MSKLQARSRPGAWPGLSDPYDARPQRRHFYPLPLKPAIVQGMTGRIRLPY